MEHALSLKNISKSFKTETGRKSSVFEDISLEIKQGEFFVIVGPSGSGKSTLLRIMSGLDKDYKGELALNPAITKQDVSFVFQQFALLPWLTVLQNVELNLIARKIPPAERRKKALQELETLGLGPLANARIHELSGGQKQRVGVARALATDPKIIFMDEPFSELDSFTAEKLRLELLDIWQKRKPTIVMVTHIIEDALELADRVAVLGGTPSHIESLATNTLPRPRDKRSADFFAMEDKLMGLIKL